MAGNRWQAGLYGNYTDPRDEQVRLIIEGIQSESGCSPSEAIKCAILVGAIAHEQEPEPVHDLCAIAPEVDLSGVHMRLDTLSEQVAQLAMEVGRLGVAAISASRNADCDTQSNYRVTDDIQPTAQELEENVPAAVHLAMTYAKAKPGMRMDESRPRR